MLNRMYSAAVGTSTALLVAMFLSVLLLIWFHPQNPHLSFGQGFHVGVCNFRDWDFRLAFFSDAQYGPYRGSIIDLTGTVAMHGFGDRYGVYYRHVQWPAGATFWTLLVSIWYPIIATAILPSIWLLRRARRPMQAGVCPRCGYDVRHSTGNCPECGATIAQKAPD
ncbi:MAG: hypothetical protein WD042_12270 [Phycisphaeraceae bacterium]